MKKILFFIPVIFLLIGFTLKKYSEHTAQSILQQIKLSEDTAQDYLFSDISGPSFYIPGTNELKAIATGERPAIIAVAGDYIKNYTKSPEFLHKYKEYKENLKPSPPQQPQSMNEMKEQQRAGLEEAIKNMENVRKSMPADQQAAFDEGIVAIKEQLKELDNPDNPMFSADMENSMKMGYDQQVEMYKLRLEEIERDYPEDPAPMIKKWLTQFLEETSDIDYNAKTANDKGKTVFVSSQYEYKSHFWKLCFRAGKETVDAARSYAQTWMNELK